MSGEERLFDAIGGVDEVLLERSESVRRRGTRPWLGWGVALAACLALVLAVRGLMPGRPAVTPEPPGTEGQPPAREEPNCTPAQPWEPWPAAEGEIHCLRIHTAPEEPEARFRIYINRELYYSCEQEGVYIIRPREEPVVPGETLPECRLEIAHMADTTVDEALEQVKASLTGLYARVEAVPGPPESGFLAREGEAYLFASNGTDWNDAQREVWVQPDGEGGAFVLSSSYFLEAAEGHGARFLDMMGTFSAEASNPDGWEDSMTELREAGERLAEAVFADDLSGVEDLLTEDAEVHGYGEDVSAWVSVASMDCAIPGNSDHATVSVKHRMGGEEDFVFLTMELTRSGDRWQAVRIGLEK